ncbi:MAG: division/cell wall cluster transcriptional repressor MraZ [Saprospiraceae bacterium]|mgnify:FL=1|jgi:MraZ protein|nr:division/cell wall cluster transcriptional repressor MraZ [Saprospiraceae bacterium]
MGQLLGEFQCRLDEKGRVRLPSSLLRQLNDLGGYNLVINRSVDKCLMLYPKVVWDKIKVKVDKLNPYVKKNREFIRYFYRGATELSPDSSERILVPKALMEYAEIERDLVLFAYNNKIEVWSQANYDAWISDEKGDDFSDIGEEILGSLNDE